MLCSLRDAIRLACATSFLFAFTACGDASFTRGGDEKPDGAQAGQNSGEMQTLGDDGDCYALGAPGQHPGQVPGKPHYPKKPIGKEPIPHKPIPKKPIGKIPCGPHQGPHQGPDPCGKIGCDPVPCDNGGKVGCDPVPCGKGGKFGCDDDYYKPIDPCDHDCGPNHPGQKPFPTQKPIVPDQCGKHGKYCDDGGPGQWPGQTVGGGKYDRHDVEKCMGAFRRAGYDTRGIWGIDVKTVKSVSVLSDDVIEDYGLDHKIVIIKAVNVLGVMRYRLYNPNALYCIRDVSVLEDVRISSCHGSNVVFGKNVNVLSKVDTRVVDCR